MVRQLAVAVFTEPATKRSRPVIAVAVHRPTAESVTAFAQLRLGPRRDHVTHGIDRRSSDGAVHRITGVTGAATRVVAGVAAAPT
jgi:hypothetical protein